MNEYFDLDLFSFTSYHKQLYLNMLFENGEQLRKVLEPMKDKVRSTEGEIDDYLSFFYSFRMMWNSRKRIVNINEDFALAQKLNLLFANADETMYPESIA